MTAAYFRRVGPTYLENWPPELASIATRGIGVPLSRDETRELEIRAAGRRGFLDEPAWPPHSDLDARLDRAIRELGGRAFVRLGSRSPKDSPLASRRGMMVADGAEALRLLCAGSERTRFDLALAVRLDVPVWIFVREWRTIPPWSEWRLFFRGGALRAACQYEIRDDDQAPRHFPELWNAALSGEVPRALARFAERFLPRSHLADVVADAIAVPAGDGSGRLELELLELNPLFPKTDPCLYRWHFDDPSDMTFRAVAPDGSVARFPLDGSPPGRGGAGAHGSAPRANPAPIPTPLDDAPDPDPDPDHVPDAVSPRVASAPRS